MILHARLSKGYVAIAITAIAVTLLGLGMIAPVVSTSTDFSIYNSGWNGTSKLAKITYQAGKFAPTFQLRANGADVTVEHIGLGQLNLDPAESALVEIGPTTLFSASEGTAVGNFVKSGGMLLLADDYGTGNSLLERMGASSRISGDLILDLSYEKQPEFVVCFDIKNDDITKNVSFLLLNYASSLVLNTTSTQTLAYSSLASWLDTNGDLYQQWGEPRGPFPILAKERMGLGTIVLLSDPSVLINGMSKYMNNSALATNLLAFISAGRSQVFFDESHRDYFDPVVVTAKFTGGISSNAKVGIVVLAFILTLWIATDALDLVLSWCALKARAVTQRTVRLFAFRRRAVEKPAATGPPDLNALAAEISTRHPDWSVGLVKYIIRESSRHGKMRKERPL